MTGMGLYSVLLAGRRGLSNEVAAAMEAEYWQRGTLNLFAKLVGIVAIGVVMWRVSSHMVIITWFLAMALIGFLSIALGTFVSRAGVGVCSPNRCRLHWVVMLSPVLLSGIAWGTGGAALLTPESQFEMFLAMALCAVAAIGAISLSTFLAAAIIFNVLVLTPSIVLLNQSDILFYRLLSYAGTAYLFIVVGFAFVLNRTSLRSLELSHRNQALVTALSYANAALETKNQDLEQALAQIRTLATLDDLTGAFNRRFLMKAIAEEWERGKRSGLTFCLLSLDLDYFKQVNDKYGHPCGDTVLRTVAAALAQQVRACDVFARMGGEEFACLLPSTSLHDARHFAERMRQVVEKLPIVHGGLKIHVTASFGLTEWQADWSIERLIHEVDRALYAAKAAGRNRISATGRSAAHDVLLA